MNDEQEIKEFEQYLIAEALSLKKDPESYIKGLGEDGLKEAYKRFQAWKLKKAKKAFHGAKLNYIKALKHQCNDDEELVYFKRGGSIGCECVKKLTGGRVKYPKNIDQASRDSIAANKYNDLEVQTMRPGKYVKKNGKVVWVPDRTKPPYNKQTENNNSKKTTKTASCGLKLKKKVKSNCVGSKLKFQTGGPFKRLINTAKTIYEAIPEAVNRARKTREAFFDRENYKGANAEVTYDRHSHRNKKVVTLPNGLTLSLVVEPDEFNNRLDTLYVFDSPEYKNENFFYNSTFPGGIRPEETERLKLFNMLRNAFMDAYKHALSVKTVPYSY